MLLSLLDGVDLKKVTIGALVIVLCGLGAYTYQQHVTLEQTRLVYSNPKTEKIVVTQTVERPKIVYRTIVKYKGREETSEVAWDAGSYTAENSSDASSPVPLSVAMAPVRTDRYLLRAGARLDLPQEMSKYVKIGIGYSFKNRLDLVVEGHRRDGRYESWADATFRF